jgi:Ca2+-transporting ATPase
MIGDVFPALALAVGKGDPSRMREPPRDPTESILTYSHWLAIGGYGALIAACALMAFFLAFQWLNATIEQTVTVSFLTLAFARLWHIFNMRGGDSTLVRNEITTNPMAWGALVLCSVLLLIGIYVPGLSFVLKLVHTRKRRLAADHGFQPSAVDYRSNLYCGGQTKNELK